MTAQTLHRAGTERPEPPLPLFEVRAELERVTNVGPFDRWVELALQRAERTGDFTRYHNELRGWLNTALSGKHQEQLLAVPYGERDAVLARLASEWIAAHPAHTSFA
ncbi:hypothetical protein KGA66_25710 [Actinocrinis puniceicyclus]|uniref:Uncharacterized protein n=1 Tax=Actinocrinis puniceicyclus TaxID=977794 RepID=A0A8J7WUP4_9ACTN|nr:hypothetical protein [Actinocrinis puniceicyclus]MBS2966464.1 hypothetical protein [Actinocrinis puniceicyclus]